MRQSPSHPTLPVRLTRIPAWPAARPFSLCFPRMGWERSPCSLRIHRSSHPASHTRHGDRCIPAYNSRWDALPCTGYRRRKTLCSERSFPAVPALRELPLNRYDPYRGDFEVRPPRSACESPAPCAVPRRAPPRPFRPAHQSPRRRLPEPSSWSARFRRAAA